MRASIIRDQEKYQSSFCVDEYACYLLKTSLRSLLNNIILLYIDEKYALSNVVELIQKSRREIQDILEVLPHARNFITLQLPFFWSDAVHDIELVGNNINFFEICSDVCWDVDVILSDWLPIWSSVQKILGYPLPVVNYLAEEEKFLRKILDEDPRHAQAFCNLAVIYLNKGRYEDSKKLFDRSLALKPDAPDTLLNYAVLISTQGDFIAAEKLLRRAISVDPDYFYAYTNLGYILSETGRYDDAEWMLRKALTINSDYVVALLNLSVPLLKRKAYTEAESILLQILDIDPDHVEASLNLFVCLLSQGKDAEAEFLLRKILVKQPACVDAMGKLGVFLAQRDYLNEAEIWLRKAYHSSDLSDESAFNLALFLLSQGNYSEGFKLYETRFMVSSNRNKKRFQIDPWNGCELAGKKIFIHAEQGFGDIIQCVRYLPLIRQRGGYIILETRPELYRLFVQANIADLLINMGEEIPTFDAYAPIMSLPNIFQTVVDNIPRQCPYLQVKDDLCFEWGQRLWNIPGCRVGVVWAGNPLHKHDESRSIPLQKLAPLADIPGVSLISLQKGGADSHLEEITFPVLCNFVEEISDFADTAAILAHLDLLVCVDTSIAHLAGALNIPTCLLLAKASDWRWLQDRVDSPWYPSLTLFRQNSSNFWDDVIADVSAHIHAFQFQDNLSIK